MDVLVSNVQKLLDICLDVAGEESAPIPFERLSVGTNEKFLKIPSDIIPANWTPDDKLGVGHERHRLIAGEGKLVFEILKQRMGIFPIYVHFLKELKFGLEAVSRSDVFQRQQNFVILAVLLQK